MAQEGKAYLTKLVGSVVCMPDIFRIKFGDKYIFSILTNDQETKDYFAISSIYDTICAIDASIKYAFSESIVIDLPDSLEDYAPFSALSVGESIAFYHTENIILRVSMLWDLLAQLCNIVFHTGIKPDKIHYKKYFGNYRQGTNSFEIANDIYAYLNEKEDTDADVNPWPGNHQFLSDYRNKMTHRLSPSITSMTSFGNNLRPPVLYVLHRAVEDYYQVSFFLSQIINQYLIDHKDWLPLGMQATESFDQ